MTEESDQSGERRRKKRTGTLKWAKMFFGNSVIDCVALDISPIGARIRTDVEISVPDEVVLQVSGGSALIAHRRWSQGTEIGFQFVGIAPNTNEHAALLALSAFRGLPVFSLNEAIQILRAAKFFDDPVLSQAAEELEAAHDRFHAVLRARFPVA